MLQVPQSEDKRRVGYVVETWSQLSETFIVNEVMALERLEVPLRIFSVDDAPPHEPTRSADPGVADVRASLTRVSLGSHWASAFKANWRVLRREPLRYGRALFQAVRHPHWSSVRCFIEAACLADSLSSEPVVHLHARSATSPALVALFAHQLTGVPYSFAANAQDICHDTPPNLLRAEVERAQAVVTGTHSDKRSLLDRVSPAWYGKLHCIHHGIDPSRFSFLRPHSANGDPPVVLCVAKADEKKGLQDLVVAADILRRRGCSFRFEIVTGRAVQQALESEVTSLGLEDWVRWVDAQPHEDICQAYQRAAILAYSSAVPAHNGPGALPDVLLEAMASGVPVVSTRVSGMSELIQSESDGLLVEPNRPEMLADALERLLTQPELRQRLGLAARAKIEAGFSIDQRSRRLLELFGPEPVSKRSGRQEAAARTAHCVHEV
ncbi:MAG TPA: glycosyltransferase family 4 protein [Terriglobia bacterium]|nr:glycosyltransferase family 4 protein [Terriglobia bacterium]